MDRAVDIGDRDDPSAARGREPCRPGTDVAVALDHDPRPLHLDAHLGTGERRRFDNPSTGGRFTSERPVELDRFTGHHAGHCVAHSHRVLVHHPGHHLGIGADVGSRHVLVGADQREDLGRVTTGDPLELLRCVGAWVDRHPTLGSAEREVHECALERHAGGQRDDLITAHLGVIADATLCWASGRVVVHPPAGRVTSGAVGPGERHRNLEHASGRDDVLDKSIGETQLTGRLPDTRLDGLQRGVTGTTHSREHRPALAPG